jgi:hypothetical protein
MHLQHQQDQHARHVSATTTLGNIAPGAVDDGVAELVHLYVNSSSSSSSTSRQFPAKNSWGLRTSNAYAPGTARWALASILARGRIMWLRPRTRCLPKQSPTTPHHRRQTTAAKSFFIKKPWHSSASRVYSRCPPAGNPSHMPHCPSGLHTGLVTFSACHISS